MNIFDNTNDSALLLRPSELEILEETNDETPYGID